MPLRQVEERYHNNAVSLSSVCVTSALSSSLQELLEHSSGGGSSSNTNNHNNSNSKEEVEEEEEEEEEKESKSAGQLRFFRSFLQERGSEPLLQIWSELKGELPDHHFELGLLSAYQV